MRSLVFVSKRFGIVSTRELEQYWLSPQAFTRIRELPLLLVRPPVSGVVVSGATPVSGVTHVCF